MEHQVDDYWRKGFFPNNGSQTTQFCMGSNTAPIMMRSKWNIEDGSVFVNKVTSGYKDFGSAWKEFSPRWESFAIRPIAIRNGSPLPSTPPLQLLQLLPPMPRLPLLQQLPLTPAHPLLPPLPQCITLEITLDGVRLFHYLNSRSSFTGVSGVN